MLTNTRKVYNLLDMLSDLGGITEVMLIIFSRFMNPISKHSFNLKVIKKLYLANTK